METYEQNKKLGFLKKISILTMCGAVLSFVGIMTGARLNIRQNEGYKTIAESVGYDEFNEEYLALEKEKLRQDYEAKLISKEQYQEKLQNIEDYDMDKFMEQYANSSQLKDYQEAVEYSKQDDSLSGIIMVSSILVGATCAGINVSNDNKIKELQKQNKQQESANTQLAK